MQVNLNENILFMNYLIRKSSMKRSAEIMLSFDCRSQIKAMSVGVEHSKASAQKKERK